MKAEVGSGKYFSVGFGSTMKDSDMVIFQAEGNGILQDLYSFGYGIPTVDTSQDYQTAVDNSNSGIYKFTAKRDLDTGDSAGDFTIL